MTCKELKILNMPRNTVTAKIYSHATHVNLCDFLLFKKNSQKPYKLILKIQFMNRIF